MIERAREAGCGALLLTVDLAVPGTRYRDYRAGLSGSSAAGGGRWPSAAPAALGMGRRGPRPPA